jgi:hypothetical protein
MARKICNFLYASDKAPQQGAIWQRGQYYIIDKAGKKDRYRYAVMFLDKNKDSHLLGYQGNLTIAKRFCNYMYIDYPFVDTMQKSWDYSKLTKKYRIKARPINTIKQTSTAAKPKAAKTPKATPQKTTLKNPPEKPLKKILDDLKTEAIKVSKQSKASKTKFANKLATLTKQKQITVKEKFELLDMVTR